MLVKASLIAACLMLAPGDQVDIIPLSPDHALHECRVKGVFVLDGLMVIRCDVSTSDGVSLFAFEYGAKRYDEIRDFATWAQEHQRPIGLLFDRRPGKGPNGCDASNCRHLLGVERK